MYPTLADLAAWVLRALFVTLLIGSDAVLELARFYVGR